MHGTMNIKKNNNNNNNVFHKACINIYLNPSFKQLSQDMNTKERKRYSGNQWATTSLPTFDPGCDGQILKTKNSFRDDMREVLFRWDVSNFSVRKNKGLVMK